MTLKHIIITALLAMFGLHVYAPPSSRPLTASPLTASEKSAVRGGDCYETIYYDCPTATTTCASNGACGGLFGTTCQMTYQRQPGALQVPMCQSGGADGTSCGTGYAYYCCVIQGCQSSCVWNLLTKAYQCQSADGNYVGCSYQGNEALGSGCQNYAATDSDGKRIDLTGGDYLATIAHRNGFGFDPF